ncbi:hypothetical protein A5775_07665 [Mycobacterium sp. 852002-10029_SCH5224772]|nr:hypothetical protein A5775_07665 [Mycobacterium sp. 852002-10029_SCH5224772]
MSAELASDDSLHQRAKDCGLHLAPVVATSLGEQSQFVMVELNLGGVREQLPIDEPSAREDTFPMLVALLVEHSEQKAKFLC